MTFGAKIGNIYQQNTDFELIETMIPHLKHRTFVDIGVEKGTFTKFLNSHGLKGVMFEPLPKFAPELHKLAEETCSIFYPYAIDCEDRMADFFVAYDHDNNPLDYFSSLHPLGQDERIKHRKTSRVTCRSLDSLLRQGLLDKNIGIVKIDTEGNDLNVLKGMTDIIPEILICEYFMPKIYAGWEQGHPLGLIEEAERLGFTHYIATKRFDEYELVSLDKTEFLDKQWGNLIFIKDTIFTFVKPTIKKIIKKKERQFTNLVFFNIQSLKQICDERSELLVKSKVEMDNLRNAGEERLELIKTSNDAISSLKKNLEESLEQLQRSKNERAIMEKKAERQSDLTIKLNDLENKIDKLFVMIENLNPYVRFSKRIKKFCRPRIGILYQYNPCPLFIPKEYKKSIALTKFPTISIVTPSFNQGQFLERTILSVINQKYPALEYTIQDGSSRDNTTEIIKSFESSLKSWESAKDNGQSHALNIGFNRTTGEIMSYLNSDDILLPGSLAFIANYFNNHPEVDVIYGHRIVINENDFEIGRWILPPHQSKVLKWADYIPQETLFWRRRIWEKVHSHIDENFRFAMDWDLILRFVEAGAKFKRLPRFLGGFRVHSEQKTSAHIEDLGKLEMELLRKRCHGRKVSFAEIKRGLLPYLIQHFFYHKLYRAGLLNY